MYFLKFIYSVYLFVLYLTTLKIIMCKKANQGPGVQCKHFTHVLSTLKCKYIFFMHTSGFAKKIFTVYDCS